MGFGAEALPGCRWRGEQLEDGRYPCYSARLVLGDGTVAGEVCRTQCPYVNHPGPLPGPQPDPRIACQHRGEESEEGKSVPGRLPLRVFGCHHPGHSERPTTTDGACRLCSDYAYPDRFVALPDDPPCAVVVGGWNWPGLIDLQLRLIRHYCGAVPVLVSDDCSDGFGWPPEPGSRYDRLQRLVQAHSGVTLVPNACRLGHGGGDLAAFWKGLWWASALGVRVLAKLSQRLLLTRPRWLQDGARDLLAGGAVLASQYAAEGPFRYEVRTEACLLDVGQWFQANVMEALRPRPLGATAESVFWRVFEDHLGSRLHPWPLFGADRCRRHAGMVWHCADPIEAYHDLAHRFGVVLDEDFTVAGSTVRPGYLPG